MAIGRLIGGTIKGTAKVAGAAVGGAALLAGVNPLAMAARMDTGLGPVFAAAMAGKKLFSSGFKKKSGGGTDKDDVINETSIVGPTGKLLAKVHKQVVAVKGLLIDSDPASALREAAFEEENRHRRLLAALSGLGGGGGGPPGEEPKSFWDWLKGLLPLLLAGLGLAMLPTLLGNLPDIFKNIQNLFDRLGNIFDNMEEFFYALGQGVSRSSKKAAKANKIRAAKAVAKAAKAAAKANKKPGVFRRFLERHARVIPTKGFGSTKVPVTEGTRRPPKPTTPATPAKGGIRSAADIVADEKSRTQRIKDTALRNTEAKKIAEERLRKQRARLQQAIEQRAKVQADLDRAKQLERKAAEAKKNSLAREHFKTKGLATKGQIARSYLSDPKVLRGLLENRITRFGGQIKLIQAGIRLQFRNLVVNLQEANKSLRVNFDKLRTNITSIQDNIRTRFRKLELRFQDIRKSFSSFRNQILFGKKAVAVSPAKIVPEKMTKEQKATNRRLGLGTQVGTGLAGESLVESRARINRSAAPVVAEKFRVEQERLRTLREKLALDKTVAAEEKNRLERQRRLELEENKRAEKKAFNERANAQAREDFKNRLKPDAARIAASAKLDPATRARLAIERMVRGVQANVTGLQSQIRLQFRTLEVRVQGIRALSAGLNVKFNDLQERFNKLSTRINLRTGGAERRAAAGKIAAGLGGGPRYPKSLPAPAGFGVTKLGVDAKPVGIGAGPPLTEAELKKIDLRNAMRERIRAAAEANNAADAKRLADKPPPKAVIPAQSVVPGTAGQGGLSMQGVTGPPPPPSTKINPGRGNWQDRILRLAKGISAALTAAPRGIGKLVDAGQIGKLKVHRVLGSWKLRVGGAAVAGIIVFHMAMKEYKEYYRTIYIPAMKKASKTSMGKKGRLVTAFDPSNPKVIAARAALWKEMMKIAVILGAGVGAGMLGAYIGGHVGTMLGWFITIFSAGWGAPSIPILALAGGIAGGYFAFTAGLEVMSSPEGDMAAGLAAKALIASGLTKQNEAVMSFCRSVYTGMIKLEDLAMAGWMKTMRSWSATGRDMYMEKDGTVGSQAAGVLIATAGDIGGAAGLATSWIISRPGLHIADDAAMSGQDFMAKLKAAKTSKASKSFGRAIRPDLPGGGMMSGVDYTSAETGMNENKLKKAIIEYNSWAIRWGDHLKPANKTIVGTKMGETAVEVYKLLQSGKFSKKVIYITMNTAFETVNVPHIIDYTSNSQATYNIGGTVMSGVR